MMKPQPKKQSKPIQQTKTKQAQQRPQEKDVSEVKHVDKLDQPQPVSLIGVIDPQLQGFTQIYLCQQQLWLRFQHQEDERAELINVRVSQKTLGDKLLELKIELMSDIDVFFHQMVILDEQSFSKMKSEQGLNMYFNQLPKLVIKVFTESYESNQKQQVLSIFPKRNGSTNLIFEQQLDFRQVILLSLDLIPLNETQMKQQVIYEKKNLLFLQVMFKYNTYKMRERQLKKQTSNAFNEMKQTNQPLFDYTLRTTGLLTQNL